MVPPGCPSEGNLNNTYNLVLKDSNGKLVAQEPVSKKTGYGIIHQQNL
jgi:hypothetical protein